MSGKEEVKAGKVTVDYYFQGNIKTDGTIFMRNIL